MVLFDLKGIVQIIERGVETRLIRSMLVKWRPPFFFLNFKETPSQEEHKTIFSSLKIYAMVLSDQIDFPAFFCLRKMTYQIFINSRIQKFTVAFAPEDGLMSLCLGELTFQNWQSAESQ
jgi:hypothetical protein